MTSTTTLPVGTRVTIDDPNYPGIWTITKVNPKNYLLRPDAGGRGLNAPHIICTEAPDGVPVLRPFESPREYFEAGQVVTYDGQPGFYVVLVDKDRRVNVARLGGDGGRYWRAAPRNLHLAVITEAEGTVKIEAKS